MEAYLKDVENTLLSMLKNNQNISEKETKELKEVKKILNELDVLNKIIIRMEKFNRYILIDIK